MPTSHDIQWVSPAPLWERRSDNGSAVQFEQPARFHFEQDAYVEELGRRLQRGPAAVQEGVLTDALWRDRDLPPGVDPDPPADVPRLYQPMQERYYTVSASLVCRRRGLPDRTVAVADDETVSMVLRRLIPIQGKDIDPDDSRTFIEFGWVDGEWRELNEPKRLDDLATSEDDGAVEQRYPMFPKFFTPDPSVAMTADERRVWNALIPTNEREDFLSAPVRRASESKAQTNQGTPSTGANGVGTPSADSRLTELRVRVINVLNTIRDDVEDLPNENVQQVGEDLSARIAFMLLDLWTFLKTYLEPVATWVEKTDHGVSPYMGAGPDLSREERALLRVLWNASFAIEEIGDNWLDAIRLVASKDEALARGEVDSVLRPRNLMQGGTVDVESIRQTIDPFTTDNGPASSDLIKAAKSAIGGQKNAEGDGGRPQLSGRNDDALFHARCVYERPRCEPYIEPTVSPATRAFRLADAMNPKAPARDHQFAMPDMGSAEDFRDAQQSVSVVLGKKLNQQIQRVKNVSMEGLSDQEVSDKGGGIAVVCQLSIPIITICALILLIVMVTVLNFIFQWLPYFMICFPIPTGSD